jgi:hypothetical protein
MFLPSTDILSKSDNLQPWVPKEKNIEKVWTFSQVGYIYNFTKIIFYFFVEGIDGTKFRSIFV